MMLAKIINRFANIYQHSRILLYKRLSDDLEINGNPIAIQPVLYKGLGKINLGINTTLGYNPSPFLYSGYIHLEARSQESVINIGDNVYINNNTSLICDRSSISIGNNVLIGTNVEIIDSDFHGILPENRKNGKYDCFPVEIQEGVFIGSNVKIMKGVTIGKNSIISNSSVVTKNIPADVIAAGMPAKVLKSIYD